MMFLRLDWIGFIEMSVSARVGWHDRLVGWDMSVLYKVPRT